MCTRSAHGFTLMELILLIVVISIALSGILLMYSTSVRGSVDPLAAKQALAVAEAMLEEVQLNAFCNPAGGMSPAPTQANRQNFDDVSDYNGYDTANEATPGIYTIDGTVGSPIAGLENYNVSVSVATAALGSIMADSGDAKLITVTATGPTNSPNQATITLAGYRTDYTGTCP